MSRKRVQMVTVSPYGVRERNFFYDVDRGYSARAQAHLVSETLERKGFRVLLAIEEIQGGPDNGWITTRDGNLWGLLTKVPEDAVLIGGF